MNNFNNIFSDELIKEFNKGEKLNKEVVDIINNNNYQDMHVSFLIATLYENLSPENKKAIKELIK
jgi:hypothetical protein